MDNILISSAGQRVSLVRAFQKEACSIDINTKVFTVDMNPILAPACQVSDGYEKICNVNDDEYIETLLEYCKNNNIGIVIPTIDTELLKLSENKCKFERENINIIVSSPNFVTKCRDKRIINKFFQDQDIDIPKEIDKKNPTFPLFIKPFDGSLSKDIYLIRHEEELLAHHLSNEKFMFMEYINPDIHDEYTIDAYYNRDHILSCAVPRKRIVIRSGEINKGVTHKNVIVDYIKERLGFIEGAIGCVTIQVFLNRDNDRIVGIEINPRFGGGYPLSYLAGANYPKWILQEYLLNQRISYSDQWEDNLLMLRYDDEVLVHDYEA